MICKLLEGFCNRKSISGSDRIFKYVLLCHINNASVCIFTVNNIKLGCLVAVRLCKGDNAVFYIKFGAVVFQKSFRCCGWVYTTAVKHRLEHINKCVARLNGKHNIVCHCI